MIENRFFEKSLGSYPIGAFFSFLLCTPLWAADLTKTLPVTYWDFPASHPDVESNNKCKGLVTGLVEKDLGKDRKPVFSKTDKGGCADLRVDNWFRPDPAGWNKRICKENKSITLNLKSGTENVYEKIVSEKTGFFPIDDEPRFTSKPDSQMKDQRQVLHNFHYCMELHATFKYQSSSRDLKFTGDDDVWFFINNKLAVDIGGEHGPESKTIQLDEMETQLGIVPGNYYNFDFFYCERHTTGSNFSLTTSIDVVPLPTPGVHIGDPNLNAIPPNDTINVYQDQGNKLFTALTIKNEKQSLDCQDVTTQKKEATTADWTFVDKLSAGQTTYTINPNEITPGVHVLTIKSGSTTESIFINIVSDAKFSKAEKAWFTDDDGDGKIESGIIDFDSAFTLVPILVKIRDPFGGPERTATSVDIVNSSQGKVKIKFEPLMPGTTFQESDYIFVGSLSSKFEEHRVRVQDSVGPVVVSAEAMLVSPERTNPQLAVEFSEGLDWDPTQLPFPFSLTRGGNSLSATDVKILRVEKQSEKKYLIIFDTLTNKYPIPGDKIALTDTRVKDMNQNSAHQKSFVVISGKPGEYEAPIQVEVGKEITKSKPFVLQLEAPTVLITLQGDTKSGASCLSCDGNKVIGDFVKPSDPDESLANLIPEITISTKYPFSFHLVFYDHLGQYVNKASGEVDAQKMKSINPESKMLNFSALWIPKAESGRMVGTGVYIVRAEIETYGDGKEVVDSQGAKMVLRKTNKTFLKNFGYFRSNIQ